MSYNVQNHPHTAPTVRRRAASAAAWPTDSDARHDSRAEAERGNTPHIPGAAVCLCAGCHLKLSRFPRRQDGRIVLPDPLAARSELGATGESFHPPARVRTRSNAHVDGGRVLEDRKVLQTRDLRDNRGEGPSTADKGYHVSRSGISVNAPDGRPHHLDVLQEFETPSSGGQLSSVADAALGTTRNRQGSLTDRSRPRRVSKPYDPKPSMILDFQGWVPGIDASADRPDPWPRIATASQQHETAPRYPGKAYPGQQQHLPTAYEDVTSHQSAASLGIRETNVSTSSTFSHSRTHSESYHNMMPNPNSKAPKSNANLGNSRPSSSHSSQYRNPSLALPQPHQQTANSAANTNSYFTDAAGVDPPPKVIRFNSRPRNPQPEVWTQAENKSKNPDTPPDMGYYEGESNSSPSSIITHGVLPTGLTGPAGEGPSSQAGLSSASHQRQQHYYHPPPQQQEYQAQQSPQGPAAPLRFQNPVTPQIHVANTTRAAAGKPRALSVVHVKWDSERKRRQGYFAAQDDGEEKSPFRHYNKTGCDYDD